jgi:hypothetical protein
MLGSLMVAAALNASKFRESPSMFKHKTTRGDARVSRPRFRFLGGCGYG